MTPLILGTIFAVLGFLTIKEILKLSKISKAETDLTNVENETRVLDIEADVIKQKEVNKLKQKQNEN
jgi:hypothetical protein